MLLAAAAGSVAVALAEDTALARGGISSRLDFSTLGADSSWGSGWRCPGVANLRVEAGEGLLEAGSDIFPNDPRPLAFALDSRFLEGSIRAIITRPGSASGVALRRTSPRDYYAAIYDAEAATLAIARRSGTELASLAQTAAPLVGAPATLSLGASGSHPTALEATLTSADGRSVRLSASDAAPALQKPGDPGVLATAQTLLPSGSTVFPALGNLHLLPYGVQEGQAFLQTPVGQEFLAEIRRRSTAGFREIAIDSPERPRPTRPSAVAATSGVPRAGGARLQVACDVPAEVWIELSRTPRFRRKRTMRAGRTGEFDALFKAVSRLPPGRRVYWRARMRRRGRVARGPVRSFRVPPRAGSGRPVTLAVGACGAQFGPIFDHLAAQRPDVFVWQGDLNYPDTHGPLAQSVSGYAGIWRDFLANPRLAPVLERACFASQRDDHDYGMQDANSTNLPPWGLTPWNALMSKRAWYRFPAGVMEVWVLDQRLFKSHPETPDTTDKTLLGAQQRRWLLRTLAGSRAPFKVICSPVTLFMPGNGRDGGWTNKFQAERDLILGHIARRVSGRTIFLTGDTHLTGVYEKGPLYEARAAPIDIPRPNDITLVDPLAAQNLRQLPDIAYAADESHFTLLKARRVRGVPTLDLTLVREDGATPYTKRFTR
jgi:PhoD-like phosphatase